MSHTSWACDGWDWRGLCYRDLFHPPHWCLPLCPLGGRERTVGEDRLRQPGGLKVKPPLRARSGVAENGGFYLTLAPGMNSLEVGMLPHLHPVEEVNGGTGLHGRKQPLLASGGRPRGEEKRPPRVEKIVPVSGRKTTSQG